MHGTTASPSSSPNMTMSTFWRQRRTMTWSTKPILLVFTLSAMFSQYNLLRKLVILTFEGGEGMDYMATISHQYRTSSKMLLPNSIILNNNYSSNSIIDDDDDDDDSNKSQETSSSSRTKSYSPFHLYQSFDNPLINTTKHRTITNTTSIPEKIIHRKWAYAFLVSGCSQEKPGYRGFLYNVVVATERLKEMGSRADFIVFIQISTISNSKTLPPGEEAMLNAVGIQILYLPKMRSSIHECFYSLVQEKFRILQLVDYSRILFLDADIMPLCNLDYMFALSEPVTSKSQQLKENVILATHTEAANAGFFMMKPNMDDWELLQYEIRKKEEKALTLPWPYFDEKEGWGHVITPPDYWRPLNGSKLTAWNWHAVFADQGLLYYWTKYIKKNVSIIIGSQIEQWSSDLIGGEPYLEKIEKDMLNTYSCLRSNRLPPPYRDFHHFTGSQKPWECNCTHPDDMFQNVKRRRQRLVEWRDTLLRVQNKTNYSFVFSPVNSEPPLGRFSTNHQMIQHIKAKKFFEWNHYEGGNDSV